MDYTETYMNTNSKLDNEKPLLLWVRYSSDVSGNCLIIIKGTCNPLPFNEIVTPTKQATRIKKWLRDQGWKCLGYVNEI